MPFHTVYHSDTTSRPSPIIWGHFPFAEWLVTKNGRDFFEDFYQFNASSSPYLYDVSDNNSTLELVAGDKKGFVRLGLTTDDNEETWILGDDKGQSCEIVQNGGRVAYEARIRTSSIADNTNGIVFGLYEEGLAVGDNIIQADDTSALSDKNYVVFRTLQADGDGLDIAYNTNGGGGETVHKEIAKTLVVDTWYNCGFTFDGLKTMKFYIDSVQVGDSLDITSTNFPDAKDLQFVFGAKVGSANTLNFDVDWVRIAQEFID